MQIYKRITFAVFSGRLKTRTHSKNYKFSFRDFKKIGQNQYGIVVFLGVASSISPVIALS